LKEEVWRSAIKRVRYRFNEEMVMAERRKNHFWTAAIFIHWYLQLQFFIPANLDYIAETEIDLLRS
jgi:hypothetical protein